MKPDCDAETWAGAAVYDRRTLNLYDALVLGFSNRFLWRCPTPGQLAFFREHLSSSHLDVGVGTGFYLARSDLRGCQRLALLDLNPECLSFAMRRLEGISPRPEPIVADVLAPIDHPTEPFRSISLFYLLHCLPGPFARKACALANLQKLLAPGGVLYGTTILGKGCRASPAASALMKAYNRRGIFSNADDSADALLEALRPLGHAELAVEGCVARFVLRTPA